MELSESKYTHVVMSCEAHQFSIYRFIEAVYYKCLPIILSKSNWSVLLEFGIEEEILREILVDGYESIVDKINEIEQEEGNRERLCNYLFDKVFDLRPENYLVVRG